MDEDEHGQRGETERRAHHPANLRRLGAAGKTAERRNTEAQGGEQAELSQQIERNHRRFRRLGGGQPQQGPEHRAGEGQPGQPPPGALPNQGQRRGGDDGEIKEQRQRVRRVARHQGGRDVGADQPERGDIRAVAQGQRRRRRGGKAEQRKGRGPRQQTVKLIAGIDRGEDDGRAGGGERLGDGGRAVRRPVGLARLAAGEPVGAGGEGDAEEGGEDHPHRGPEQAVIDRQFDEKGAAQRDGAAAEPDQPGFRQRLLPAAPPLRGTGSRRRGRCRPGPGRGGSDRCGRDRRRRDRRGLGGRGRRDRGGRGGRCRHRLGQAEQAVLDHAVPVGQLVEAAARAAVCQQRPDRQNEGAGEDDGQQRPQIVPIHLRLPSKRAAAPGALPAHPGGYSM